MRDRPPRKPAPSGPPRGATRGPEIKVCGRHAARAVFDRRANEIVRVYLVQELTKAFGDLLSACAKMRRPYKVVGADELEKITESRHHEGICVVVAARPPRALAEVLAAPGPAAVVALAGVANPHNTGAIVRTAAHFGARAVLVEGPGKRLPPAVYRTAQGGAEWVEVFTAPELGPLLAEARRAGYSICATSSHGGASVYEADLAPRIVFLLGAEDEGLAPELARGADASLRIPGTERVESLNVAAAAAVLLAEAWRRASEPSPQHSPGSGGPHPDPLPRSGRGR
jgi:TrmH RNA methyltransferase